MKHSYLRAAMLDIGEWIREWNPGEDVVILLWCRGLQWRGDVVPTAQLHKKTEEKCQEMDNSEIISLVLLTEIVFLL